MWLSSLYKQTVQYSLLFIDIGTSNGYCAFSRDFGGSFVWRFYYKRTLIGFTHLANLMSRCFIYTLAIDFSSAANHCQSQILSHCVHCPLSLIFSSWRVTNQFDIRAFVALILLTFEITCVAWVPVPQVECRSLRSQ